MFRFFSGFIAFLFMLNSVVTVDLSLSSSKGRQNVFLAPAAELPTTPPQRQIISAPLSEFNFSAQKIKDSKGRPTVQVTIKYRDIEVKGMVPAGTSTGDDEANTVPTDHAIENLEKVVFPTLTGIGEIESTIVSLDRLVLPALKRRQGKGALDLSKHQNLIAVEEWLIQLAGDNFKALGANATVPLS